MTHPALNLPGIPNLVNKMMINVFAEGKHLYTDVNTYSSEFICKILYITSVAVNDPHFKNGLMIDIDHEEGLTFLKYKMHNDNEDWTFFSLPPQAQPLIKALEGELRKILRDFKSNAVDGNVEILFNGALDLESELMESLTTIRTSFLE
jgi:hypothetical protein